MTDLKGMKNMSKLLIMMISIFSSPCPQGEPGFSNTNVNKGQRGEAGITGPVGLPGNRGAKGNSGPVGQNGHYHWSQK